jgi:hypothetical protein
MEGNDIHNQACVSSPARISLVLIVMMLLLAIAVQACGSAEPSAEKKPEVDLIQVPLRWCALEGTSAVDNPSAVGESTTDNVLWRRHERASDNIWIPGANITFRSAMISSVTVQANFPIITDPRPPSQNGPGMLGDIQEPQGSLLR